MNATIQAGCSWSHIPISNDFLRRFSTKFVVKPVFHQASLFAREAKAKMHARKARTPSVVNLFAAKNKFRSSSSGKRAQRTEKAMLRERATRQLNGLAVYIRMKRTKLKNCSSLIVK